MRNWGEGALYDEEAERQTGSYQGLNHGRFLGLGGKKVRRWYGFMETPSTQRVPGHWKTEILTVKTRNPKRKWGGADLSRFVLFCFLFEAGLHCTAQAGLELTTLLPLECWEDRHHHTSHAEALTVGLPSRRLLRGLNSNLPAVERE